MNEKSIYQFFWPRLNWRKLHWPISAYFFSVLFENSKFSDIFYTFQNFWHIFFSDLLKRQISYRSDHWSSDLIAEQIFCHIFHRSRSGGEISHWSAKNGKICHRSLTDTCVTDPVRQGVWIGQFVVLTSLGKVLGHDCRPSALHRADNHDFGLSLWAVKLLPSQIRLLLYHNPSRLIMEVKCLHFGTFRSKISLFSSTMRKNSQNRSYRYTSLTIFLRMGQLVGLNFWFGFNSGMKLVIFGKTSK